MVKVEYLAAMVQIKGFEQDDKDAPKVKSVQQTPNRNESTTQLEPRNQ